MANCLSHFIVLAFAFGRGDAHTCKSLSCYEDSLNIASKPTILKHTTIVNCGKLGGFTCSMLCLFFWHPPSVCFARKGTGVLRKDCVCLDSTARFEPPMAASLEGTSTLGGSQPSGSLAFWPFRV